MERGFQMLEPKGYSSMITMETWMFLSRFEVLRRKINRDYRIVSMVHMPYLGKGGTSLGINFRTDMAIISNYNIKKYVGVYDRVSYYETDKNGVPHSFPVMNEYYKHVSQDSFAKIPGAPVAYWLNHKFMKCFDTFIYMRDIGIPRTGMMTGNNARFLRLWWEPCINDCSFTGEDADTCAASSVKWFAYNKGGEYRRWYGNNDYVLNWQFGGREVFGQAKQEKRNSQDYPNAFKFKEAITWPQLTTGIPSFRIKKNNLFDITGLEYFPNNKRDIMYLLGLCNSNAVTYILHFLNPTIHYQGGDIGNIPVPNERDDMVTKISEECVKISQTDWDSYETSWDFKYHPLTNVRPHNSQFCGNDTIDLKERYSLWEDECEQRFQRLKANEEKLNRTFIDIYGLQDELTPTVDDKEVSISRADLGRDIRSLISYSVGCMFGRYSISKEGLQFAGGNWEEWKKQPTFSMLNSKFRIDDDNCLPITDEPYFEDDIVARFVDFIRVVYGQVKLEENLDFIAKALGNKGNTSREVIRNYFLNDFMKDHIRIYQKRPIYWLFDSGKQNGFKALVYMHRWNADTVGNLRVEYLHRMQHVYEKEIERMQDIIDNSRDNREVNQASKRREKLVKQLKEARDYDAKIAHVALSRVEIDLDDGVKVNYEKVQKGPDGKSLGILVKI